MKTRQVIHHSILFIVAFAAFGLSIISAIHISDSVMETHLSAIWVFVQILISVAGLVTLPIFIISLFIRIIGTAIQAPTKQTYEKHKNTSLDTIASSEALHYH